MRTTLCRLSIAICFVIVGGCSENDNLPHNTKAEQRPATQTASTADSAVAPAAPQAKVEAASAPHAGKSLPDPLRGRVKETMDAGGYSYMLLETDQGSTWAAARTLAVKVGDEVEVAGMMPMRNFSSPTLQRTFEEIQFVSAARVVGEGDATGTVAAAKPAERLSMPPGHPPIGGQADSAKTATAAAESTKVEPLSDGFTVAQLFAKATELKSKPVKFRGRVVKANRGILGKNWLHIQDGSGSAGTNDITVTSVTGFAPVGSVVTVEGTLNTDRDFGAGYSYEVIVEDSEVTMETASGTTEATP